MSESTMEDVAESPAEGDARAELESEQLGASAPEVESDAALASTSGPGSGQRAERLVVWVPAAKPPVVTALQAAEIELTDDPDRASRAIVSTRLPRHRVSEFSVLAQSHELPVIVLVHPGGETAAVEALRAGADAAIAEGDVLALRALAGDPDAVSSRIGSLLEAYETRLGRQSSAAAAMGGSRTAGSLINPISGLPGHAAMTARLASAALDTEHAVRIVSMAIPELAQPAQLRLGSDAAALLHRRLAMAIKSVCGTRGELFDLGEGMFSLVAPRMEVDEAERLGRAVIDVVEAYTPDAHSQLSAAVGHAGPECSNDLPTLRELAGRAEAAAAVEERSTVLGAGELVGPLATATELEVTLRLADIADEDGAGPSRSTVARVANDLATKLGFEGTERLLVRFCAHVAGIGSVLAAGKHPDTDPLDVAAKHLGTTAGPAVSFALLHLREHWDGSGSPNGVAGTDIPATARIIAVAEALVANGWDLDDIASKAGTIFDPTVAAAAAEIVRPQ